MSKGNLKTEGAKGNNFSWQFNMLKVLGDIATAIPAAACCPTAATEATQIAILNAISASGKDFEILLVRDTGAADIVVEQIIDFTTGVPVYSYRTVNGAVYVPVGPLVYLDPAAVLNLILTQVSNHVIAAGENHIGSVGGNTGFTETTMTLDTAAYISGDVLTDTATLGVILRTSGGTGIIHSVTLLDENNQKQPLDIVFFRTNVSLGTKNSPVTISDADAREILGIVKIEASDYTDLVNSAVVTKTHLGIGVKGDGIDQIYVSMISRGTGTYTSAGISLMTTVLQD